jgi:hypothetical protein
MLKQHHLVFVAELPTSNIVEQLTLKLSKQLADHNLILTTAPETSSSLATVPWFHLPYIVVEPSRRKTLYTSPGPMQIISTKK